jgi:hypothetical protein
MPWKCLACQTSIQHDHKMPWRRRGVISRCHVCRLELVIDPATEKLALVPLLEKT